MTEVADEPGDVSGPDIFRRLADAAPVGMGQVDLATSTITYVNRRWREITGIDRPTPIDFAAFEGLIHADDRPTVDKAFARSIEHGEPFEADCRLRTGDDSVRFVRFQGAPVFDGHGTLRSYAGVMVDLTELAEVERELRDSERRYRHLVEEAPVGQIVSELDGTLVEVNNAFVRMMRSSREELLAREPRRLFHPDDLPMLAEHHRRLIAGEIEYYEAERRMIRGDGSVMWGSGGTSIITEGGRRYLHSVVQDTTEKNLASEALAESEVRFRTLANALPLGVFISSVDGELVYVNRRWSEITGVPPADALGSGTLDLVHPDDRDEVVAARDRLIEDGGIFAQQMRMVKPSGDVRWVSVHASVANDADTGELTGFIGSMEDITPLVEAEEEKTRLAGIVEATSDMVGVADAATGQLRYLNRSARELLGVGDADIADMTALDLYTDDAITTWEQVIEPALSRGETWSGELAMRVTDGSTVQVWQTIAANRLAGGRMTQISAVGRDVTARRRFEAALAHRATHDALTDLPNRTLLLDHLELAIARSDRDRTGIALLFLDLDRFKSVNDTLGHDVGDELLIAVAGRINDMLRPADTVARIGGDEFVILCEDIVDEHHAVSIAQRILSLIEATPFRLGDAEVSITASIGIALSAGGDGAHPEALLRDADAAMYRAKDLGRARLELFDESMRRRAAERLEIADELARALETDQIVVHYQPCVSLRTGRVTGVEALARWDHPDRGVLAPAEFIGLAEETGLIVGLGLRVLTDACAQAKSWADELGTEAPRVHVNLSARQLTAPNLSLLVRGVLEGSGLPPQLLCLEITESVLMEDAPAVIDALRRLKDIGVLLAIDDFGTGYSSLSYLRRFPVDVLKVDQSFVDGLGPDPEDSAIVAAIVNLAATLELEAVAEGVETHEQLELLRALGCATAQGFIFAEPAPAAELGPRLGTTFDL
jgi:diguanylate cyclase (GGDEF)-like protein/PAS domain S-box-containing protein